MAGRARIMAQPAFERAWCKYRDDMRVRYATIPDVLSGRRIDVRKQLVPIDHTSTLLHEGVELFSLREELHAVGVTPMTANASSHSPHGHSPQAYFLPDPTVQIEIGSGMPRAPPDCCTGAPPRPRDVAFYGSRLAPRCCHLWQPRSLCAAPLSRCRCPASTRRR